MFKRKPADPLKRWDDTPSRLGWSVLDDRLVEVRFIVRGKVLQLRFVDDGTFPVPEGFSQGLTDQLLEDGRWEFSPVLVEAHSGGTRVAGLVSELFGFMLHNRHAGLILYRIAHGMLYPDEVLLETLADVPSLMDEMRRIDLGRIRAEVPEGRVPTADEQADTLAMFLEQEAAFDRFEEMAQVENPSKEVEEAALEMLMAAVDRNPLKLDGAPYMRD